MRHRSEELHRRRRDTADRVRSATPHRRVTISRTAAVHVRTAEHERDLRLRSPRGTFWSLTVALTWQRPDSQIRACAGENSCFRLPWSRRMFSFSAERGWGVSRRPPEALVRSPQTRPLSDAPTAPDVVSTLRQAAALDTRRLPGESEGGRYAPGSRCLRLRPGGRQAGHCSVAGHPTPLGG
jgi:hypothetical protein